MTARLATLDDAAISSLTIHNFIYHILVQGAAAPDYLDRVTLTRDQSNFFKEMIIECAKGTQYAFADPSHSVIYQSCDSILSDPQNNFIDRSRDLASNFLSTHPHNASDGILIVAQVSMVINTITNNFIAILKVDYTKVLEQVRDRNQPGYVSFNEIVDSLSENKSSIQKRALIDIGTTFNWDVLAVERGKTGQQLHTDVAISDYFKSFLSVNLMHTDSTYARKVPSAVYQWARTEAEIDASDAKAISISVIKSNDGCSMSMDDIKDRVCSHDDSAVVSRLRNSFDTFMSSVEVQLSGVQFVARGDSIRAKDSYAKMETNYGVTIQWEGERQDAMIEKIVLPNGQLKIEIIADNVTESN